MTDSDVREWRTTFGIVAEKLPTLDLTEVCEITIETNGATGGFDVFIDGVEDTDGLGMPIFVRRVLSITNNGVERVQ